MRVKQTSLSIVDRTFLLAILGLSLWLGADARPAEFNPQWDMASYRHMAESLDGFRDVVGHHGQRVLGPWLVLVVDRITPLGIDSAFRVWSVGLFSLFALLSYGFLRRLAVRPGLAWFATVMSLISFWPTGYTLSNYYQLTDLLMYPFTVAIVWCAREERTHLVGVFGVFAVVARQSLILLVVAALGQVAVSRRRWRVLLWLVPVIGLYVVISLFAGERYGAGLDGNRMVWVHTGANLADPLRLMRHFVEGSRQSRLPLLFLPFLPVALLPSFWKALPRYWYVAAPCVLILLQPLVAWDISGGDNGWRIMMPAVIPFFWAGAVLLNRIRFSWWPWVFAVLPFVHGTVHLSWLRHPVPPVWHRYIVSVVVAGMTAYVWWRERSDALVRHRL